jgi:hypothetical protein
MSRELRCKNKDCKNKEDPIFNVEIEVSKYLEVARNLHFTQYPISHFTCASCGLIPIEVKV